MPLLHLPASPCQSSEACLAAMEDQAGLCLEAGTSMSRRGTMRSPDSSPQSAAWRREPKQVGLKARAGEEGIPPFQEGRHAAGSTERCWIPQMLSHSPFLHPCRFLTERGIKSKMAGLFIEVFV